MRTRPRLRAPPPPPPGPRSLTAMAHPPRRRASAAYTATAAATTTTATSSSSSSSHSSLLPPPTAAGLRALLLDWRHFPLLTALLVLGEALLGAAVVLLRRYTEIDWRAYVQEVEGWTLRRAAPLNYLFLRGDTGPCVYPAGFLHVFRALVWLATPASGSGSGSGSGAAAASPACEAAAAAEACIFDFGATCATPAPCGGQDVRPVQWAFLAVYLATLALALDVLARARPGPPWACLLLAASYRLHSVYLLRLFNDCVAMLFFFGALSLLARRRFLWGTLLVSLSVSVKMNALLLLPALGLVLLRNVGAARTALCLAAGAALQLALAAPFLLAHPREYLAKAFEFSREFTYRWSVNLKFLPEAAFRDKRLAFALLAAHLAALLLLAHASWLRRDGGLPAVVLRALRSEAAAWAAWLWPQTSGSTTKRAAAAKGAEAAAAATAITPDGGAFRDGPLFIALLLLSANFVGVAFARTLHYQFLSWYWLSLPLLLWRARLVPSWAEARLPGAADAARVLVAAAVAAAFSDADAAGEPTARAALLLQAAHAWLLAGLFVADAPDPAQ